MSFATTQRHRTLRKTIKVRVLPQQDRVPRLHHIAKGCTYGTFQSIRYPRVASTSHTWGPSLIPRFLQFLSTIYQRLLEVHLTYDSFDKNCRSNQIHME